MAYDFHLPSSKKDLANGREAEEAFINFLKANNFEVQDHAVLGRDNPYQYDLTATKGEAVNRIEIKSNAGESATGYPYSTFFLETYIDDVRPPQWRTADVDYLVEVNRATKTAYIYSVEKLRKYVEDVESMSAKELRAKGIRTSKFNDCPGILIPWNCKEAGCVKTVCLKRYWP